MKVEGGMGKGKGEMGRGKEEGGKVTPDAFT